MFIEGEAREGVIDSSLLTEDITGLLKNGEETDAEPITAEMSTC
jgi:hypothetical protein